MKEKDNKTEVITLRLSPDLKKKLVEQAEKEHRTMSNYLQMIIEKTVEKK